MIKERRKRGEDAGPPEPTDIELLVQIRDLLAGGVPQERPEDHR